MVYLDNAATTPMLPEVVEVMQKSMLENFGNPSSTHQFGRRAKSVVETARKSIAKYFNVSSSEIIFTSSGTEANNLVLQNAVKNLGVKRIITSRIEHYAVLRVVEYLEETYSVDVDYVDLDGFGGVDLSSLERLLIQDKEKTLVSLMMVNNEIGNLLDVLAVGQLCKKYNSLFHSDTVQAIGEYEIDLQEISIDFLVASAHKFHGPKGVGFVFVRKGLLVKPMLLGGGQEKGMRSGTENVHAILGLQKALEIAYNNLDVNNSYKRELKSYCIEGLKGLDCDVAFNGCSFDLFKSSAKILNFRLPIFDKMILFNLDLQGLSVSSGSACQSGANKMSHVLKIVLSDEESKKSSLRFSFSKLTTKKDVDFSLNCIERVLKG